MKKSIKNKTIKIESNSDNSLSGVQEMADKVLEESNKRIEECRRIVNKQQF